jgi:hypothetical protein
LDARSDVVDGGAIVNPPAFSSDPKREPRECAPFRGAATRFPSACASGFEWRSGNVVATTHDFAAGDGTEGTGRRGVMHGMFVPWRHDARDDDSRAGRMSLFFDATNRRSDLPLDDVERIER